ncbi:E3 Ubiquitin ligase family protein [Wolffia australiana]
MSSRDQTAAAVLAGAAAACDGAIAGALLAYAAARAWLKFRRSSAALAAIAGAPFVPVSGLRSVLSDDDSDGAGKLVVVRGEVRPMRGSLVSQGSGEAAVVLQRTSTCLYSEWRGVFGWSIDLHALLAKTWKEQHSSAVRTVPFVLVDDGRDSVSVKLDGSTHHLPLTTVYHQLLPVQATTYSFIQAMFGHGYPVALLDEEKILPVGKEITAVGLCRLKDDGILEIKSSDELPCFLSELTKAEMESDLAINLKILLWSGIILGALSAGILGYAIQRNFRRFKQWWSRRRLRQQTLGPEDSDVEEEDLGHVPDGGLCVICLVRRRRCAFVPCGHRVCCGPCAAAVNRDSSPKCPVCRQHAPNYLMIFDS